MFELWSAINLIIAAWGSSSAFPSIYVHPDDDYSLVKHWHSAHFAFFCSWQRPFRSWFAWLRSAIKRSTWKLAICIIVSSLFPLVLFTKTNSHRQSNSKYKCRSTENGQLRVSLHYCADESGFNDGITSILAFTPFLKPRNSFAFTTQKKPRSEYLRYIVKCLFHVS